MDRKKVIKIGLSIAAIIVAVTLTMVFSRGTIETGVYSATLRVTYEDLDYSINFSFNISDTEEFPEFTFKEYINSTLIWYRYSPKIYLDFSKSFFLHVALTDFNNITVYPVPNLDDFELHIVGDNFDQILPAVSSEEDFIDVNRNTHWFSFRLRLPYQTNIVMSLLFVVGILWITETIPLAATSLLIPIAGAVLIQLQSRTVLAPFADPVIYLFLGGFIIAKAMNKTGLDKLIALNIVRISPDKPRMVMLLMMVLAAFLSMFMSNTATAATMIPIATAVVDKLKVKGEVKEEEIDRYGKALVLGIAYSASIGGVGSAIGTPANPIAIALLNEYAGAEITFAKWFLFGLPLVIVMIPIMWAYLWFVYKPKVPKENIETAKSAVKKELDNMGPLNKKQIYVFAVFIIALILWLTESLHNISSAIVALIAAVLLFIPQILKDRDIRDLNWSSLVIFGGGLALGVIMTETGASDLIAFSIANLRIANTFVIIIIVALLSVMLTFVASNTGTAAIMIPLVIPLALLLKVDPILLAVVAAVGASIDTALPTGTPPTLIAYATGKYKVSEMVKIGGLVMIIGTVLLMFVLPFLWKVFGIVQF
ncbi:MAG: SLC13 family permease [Candidatus Heimdallarchaeaceae archaeon]|jgi:sodium-dependent dicarboxylate transporter 2/3/5